MRIAVAFIILVVVGGLLTANLIIDNRTPSSAELENVRTVCQGCHGQVPQYDFASQVHNKHASFECSFCHRDNNGMKTAGNLHNGLEWFGIGIMLFGFIGIITNMFIIYRKSRVN